MPSGEANGLTRGHTRGIVCGHANVCHGDRGARGGKFSLL